MRNFFISCFRRTDFFADACLAATKPAVDRVNISSLRLSLNDNEARNQQPCSQYRPPGRMQSGTDSKPSRYQF